MTMIATEKQLSYISRLMGDTYAAEYDKLTVKTASALITAIVAYKRPVLCGGRADDSMLAFVYENLCHAEILAFGHTFAKSTNVEKPKQVIKGSPVAPSCDSEYWPGTEKTLTNAKYWRLNLVRNGPFQSSILN